MNGGAKGQHSAAFVDAESNVGGLMKLPHYYLNSMIQIFI